MFVFHNKSINWKLIRQVAKLDWNRDKNINWEMIHQVANLIETEYKIIETKLESIES